MNHTVIPDARRRAYRPTTGLPAKLQPVARLVGKGLSNKDISQQTGLTLNTVKKYVSLSFDELAHVLPKSSRKVLGDWANQNLPAEGERDENKAA